MRHHLFLLFIFISGCDYLNPLMNLDRHPVENAHVFFIKNECPNTIRLFATNKLNNSVLYEANVSGLEDHFFWIHKNVVAYEDIGFSINEPDNNIKIEITLDENRYLGELECPT